MDNLDLLDEKCHKGRIEKLVILTDSKLIFFLLDNLMERQEAGKMGHKDRSLKTWGQGDPCQS